MNDAWNLTYDRWDPDDQPRREVLCALGNGRFVTRAAFEEVQAGGVHYPGTYVAGGYDRIETDVGGRVIENEDLVNWPNWLPLAFRHVGEEDDDHSPWLTPEVAEILSFRQTLDLRHGVLERAVVLRDPGGRETELLSRRLVHMDDAHVAALAWRLTPRNWSGPIELRSALDGRVENAGVARYRDLRSDHLEPVDTGLVGEEGIDLVVRTRQSGIVMAQAARTSVCRGERQVRPVAVERETRREGSYVAQHLRFTCERDRPTDVEKVVTLFTSRDHAISEPRLEAGKWVLRAPGFGALLADHRRAWERLWSRCDIELGAAGEHERAQRILRLHVFHLLQTASPNTIGLDVGVPPRGWHGEAYRGHVFWDELYIFPFLNLRIPELTRSLLLYRFRRLPEAVWAAREAGHRGAMFPWQSGSDGREESQIVHLNPESGRWIPDETRFQRHVGAAVAYNVWQYYEATRDRSFLAHYGVEILLEVSRFLSSLAALDGETGRYRIRGVVGPDEFHTHYPEAEEPGLVNNAYTNVLASWVLGRTLACLDLISRDRRRELLDELQVPDDEVARWEEVSRRLAVPMRGDGIILQFEGWDELQELDWGAYRERYGDIQRLDRLLEAEGDDVNRYKAAKQADVLMLFYLFSTEELSALFERLGYPFEPEMIPRNIDYYLARTAHGSTLSSMVHSWVLSRRDRSASWRFFERALRSDVDDLQGGTTPEGIHLGAMAGTVDLVQRCYVGVEMREEILWLNPRLPEELTRIGFTLRYRGHWLWIEVAGGKLTVSFRKGWWPDVQVGFADRVYTFRQGETRVFDLESGRPTGDLAESARTQLTEPGRVPGE